MSAEIGIGFTPLQLDVGVAVRLAQRAEALGYAQVGTAEGWTHDAFVLLTRMASETSRIELGTGVVSVWSRTPAALAMAAISVQRASGRPFHLGLGASAAPLVEGLHGVGFTAPLARLRSTAETVRGLLDGGRARPAAPGVMPLGLGLAPEQPISIALAALAPRSIRLAGELADHWLPFLWPRSRLAGGRRLLDEGAAAAGRPVPRTTVAVPAAIAQDPETARLLAAGWLLAYLTRMGPLYPRMLRERGGLRAEVDAFLSANAGGGMPVLPAAAERLAREVTLMGTHAEAPGLVRDWLDAGADGVQIVLPPMLAERELADVVEAASGAVAPAPLVA